MVYQANVTITTQYGQYAYCDNNQDGEHTGYYLTQYPIQNVYGKTTKQMVTIDITINDELLNSCNMIDIYHGTKFLAQTLIQTKNKHYSLFIGLEEKVRNDVIFHINYKKFKSHTISTFFRLSPRIFMTFYEQNIMIPTLQIKGSLECPICDDKIIDTNVYISECSHLFHMTCLWKYLEYNHYLKPIAPHCLIYQEDHGQKVRPFPCPICWRIIENH